MKIDGVLSWLLALARRFFTVAPRPTLLGACCSVASQVLMAVAAFLPFKALSLAVHDVKAPHLWQAEHIERRVLIIGLCLLAFGCYALHLLCKRHLDRCVSEGAQTLMQRTRKLGLFDKQDSIAEDGYRRFSLGLASLAIGVLCLAMLAGWNRPLLWGVLAYMGLALLVVLPLARRYTWGQQLLEHRLDQVLETLGGLGFISSFVYLVVEFIGTQHALMIGVGSLIVVRQYFRSLTVLLRAGVELWRKRLQLSALFFHHQVLIEDTEADDFWQLFAPPQRDAQMREALQQVLGQECAVDTIAWQPSGTSDVVSLVVTARVQQQTRTLCLRVFNHTRVGLAQHEAALLCAGLDLPPSGFIGALYLRSGFHCHAFDITGYHAVEGKELVAATTQLRRQLLYREPPAELVSTYGRSKSYLWQRLSADMAIRLGHLLGRGEHDACLLQFATQLPAIVAQLRRLPLGFAQPGMGKHSVLCNDRDRALLCSWDRWLLDSLGYDWPADNDARLDQLHAALVDAAAQRSDLPLAVIPVARLCALLGAFEQRYQRQDYQVAVQLLMRAMAHYNTLEKKPVVQRQGAH
jgi:hypothetical protein